MATESQHAGGAIAAGIEAHSIDIIPESERTGRVRSQFTLWFATNANVFNFVLGGFVVAGAAYLVSSRLVGAPARLPQAEPVTVTEDRGGSGGSVPG